VSILLLTRANGEYNVRIYHGDDDARRSPRLTTEIARIQLTEEQATLSLDELKAMVAADMVEDGL